MTTVTLRPEVAEQVQSAADRRKMDLDELVNDWLEEQLWEDWNRKIAEEMRRFLAQHQELLVQYRGKYIAMQDGIVLDNDPDLGVLHDRVREQYGDVPILMTLVSNEPIQTFRVRSPRLEMGAW